jgi:hypothetical protein
MEQAGLARAVRMAETTGVSVHLALILFLLMLPWAALRGADVNLSSYGTVKASSEEKAKGNLAANAIDGNPQTRWCVSGLSPGAWLAVDLGSPCTLSKVRVIWENATDYTYRYKLEGSLDGKTWSTIEALGSAPKGTGETKFTGVWRHVRVVHENANTTNWSSIRELEVYGLPVTR